MPVRLTLLSLVVFSAVVFQGRCPSRSPRPNVAWVGDKTYGAATTPLAVTGLGINSTVDVLPAGTAAITPTRSLINNGPNAVAAGYTVKETIVKLNFVAAGASTGFVPGATVADLNQPGPALAPGARAPITFAAIPITACGLYLEILEGPGGVKAQHYFAVEGTMKLDRDVVPPGLVGAVELDHGARNELAYTVTFTPATPTTTFDVLGPMTHPVIGSQGSTGTLTPGPVAGVIATGATAAVVVTYRINGFTHNNAPCTDILRERLVESVNTLVSAITTDRCVIRQAALPVNVLHPCR